MKRFLFLLTLLTLACGSTTPRRKLDLYPTPTVFPTQTARVLVVSATVPTATPIATQTPQISTQTAVPDCFVVSASQAVYLRPSASSDNYPITPLPNGTRLIDLGGRSNGFAFVQFGTLRGWVYTDYLMECK